MENVFFKKAYGKAAGITSKQHRLLRLVSQLFYKLQRVNWHNASAQSIRSKMAVFGRISKAYAMGYYRAVPWRTILIIVAAIVYFVNPFDLIPDLVPVAGLTDDLGVLLWVYSSVSGEIEKFLEWERTRLPLS